MSNARPRGRAPLVAPQMIPQLRRIGLLEAAADESSEIVLRTAAQITQLAHTATGELSSLQQQVEATIGAIEPPRRESRPWLFRRAHRDPKVRALSPEAHEALQDARRAVDGLLQELVPSIRQERPRLTVRIRTLVPATVAILVVAAALGVATGWLSEPLSTSTQGAPPPAAVATTGTTPAEAGRVSATSPDDLRPAAEAWLRTYFETGSPPASGSPPAIRDERLSQERLAADAVRRVIAPARIDVFGDAAVLSTTVTEVPKGPPAREVVALVAQLWTRTSGQWHLDDVRIVSAKGAGHAFRR